MDQRAISMNINEEWHDFKEMILKVADEVLGKRSIKGKRKGIQNWNEEIEKLINNKKEAYLKYPQTNSEKNISIKVQ